MKNKYLQIILKKRTDRTLLDLLTIMAFWECASPQEIKYAYNLMNALGEHYWRSNTI